LSPKRVYLANSTPSYTLSPPSHRASLISYIPYYQLRPQMVFGLFSRKSAASVGSTPATNHNPPHRVQQLRTPSPSIASGGSIGNPTNSPSNSTIIRPHSALVNAITPSPPPTTDPTALRSLILTIPPKILHSYVLTHLSPPPITPLDLASTPPVPSLSPLTLTILTSFFSALTPPPLLHCARCHKGFFDVENDDRSCTVGHDDDSAEVERVGRGAGYETLWGCCGRTVDGDGDMGPPDGWCYEGKHTVRFLISHFFFLSDNHLANYLDLYCILTTDGRKTRSIPRRLDDLRR